jgi:hypothetical protein
MKYAAICQALGRVRDHTIASIPGRGWHGVLIDGNQRAATVYREILAALRWLEGRLIALPRGGRTSLALPAPSGDREGQCASFM